MDDYIERILKLATQTDTERKLPPVDDWNPNVCGEIDIRIASNGDWFHQGILFTRPELMSLLSKLLRQDDGQYFLVTPTEKMRIQVDETPFVVVNAEYADRRGVSSLIMKTQCGDYFTVDHNHFLWVCTQTETKEPRPYVRVRSNLIARIERSVFYRLVNNAHQKRLGSANFLYLDSGGYEILLGEL